MSDGQEQTEVQRAEIERVDTNVKLGGRRIGRARGFNNATFAFNTLHEQMRALDAKLDAVLDALTRPAAKEPKAQ